MSLQTATIAVIMPVWRQAGLADEAIASVLAQTAGAGWHLIIVNDGCPEAETAGVLDAWRLRAPDDVTVLTQANAGLAAARNTGIDFALRAPGIQALFFLDADNRLDASAMQLFQHLLATAPKAGWFYPNFDMFGLEGPQAHGGVWSLARMAISNMCDAGSLVRRTLCDAGVRFDANMRNGYEDWDFWLSAAKLGFEGYAVGPAFFRYRKRGQSMLRTAHDDGFAMTQALRRKHDWLFGAGRLAAVYAAEWPRFAFVAADGSATFGDWPQDDREPSDAVEQAWFAAQSDPFSSRLPQSWVFAAPEALDYLLRTKRLGSVLMEIEASLAEGHIVALRFEDAPSTALRPGMRYVDKSWESLNESAILALPRAHLSDAAAGADLLDCMTRLMARGVIAPLTLTSVTPPKFESEAVEAAVGFVGRISESTFYNNGLTDARPWRPAAQLASPVQLRAAVSALNLGGLHLPGPVGIGPHIGFAVPILSFGGVEKCVVALAGALREQGAVPHLFLFGDDPAQPDDWLVEPFETIHQLTRPELRDWSGARYLGTADGRAPGHWLAGRLFGPMTALDALINAGCGPVNSVVGALRRFGVKTATWEHLIDQTKFGRANGTPYLALSNEAAYDHVLTCSRQLADWLAGQAVARDKLLCLPNGPGFPDVATQRNARPLNAPLRVGFFGRLDFQKAVDRFVEIATAIHGAQFEFSLVGSGVLNDSSVTLPEWIIRHPLARTPQDLSQAYARLDVLLMPSRAEGLPLAILEAQRAGVVPMVSDVGAVREAIEDGVNGIILPADSVVPSAIAALTRLAVDRAELHRLATAPKVADRWAHNAQALISALGFDPLA